MAHTNWSVEYPVDPAASLTGPIPVGAKLLSSLTAALSEAPLDQWAFEIDGEPVDGYQTSRSA
ncbi:MULTISPECIES: hypothetical protein [unclassified Streptomyces]|uniref:hypothetical protein n=1 Tax=unclassified Streptomyces TaxID=2593676 RepID=UPI0036EDE641